MIAVFHLHLILNALKFFKFNNIFKNIEFSGFSDRLRCDSGTEDEINLNWVSELPATLISDSNPHESLTLNQ